MSDERLTNTTAAKLQPRIAEGSNALDSPVEWVQVIETIIDSGRVCLTVKELHRLLGWEPILLGNVLDSMSRSGWLAVWSGNSTSAALMTLTPWIAARFQVHVVERGGRRTTRWGRCQESRHWRRPMSMDHEVRLDLDSMASEELFVPGIALNGEISERTEASDGWVMHPTHFVGTSMGAWMAATREGVPCPGCNDRPLASGVYCLICDRWGGDQGAQSIPLTSGANDREVQPQTEVRTEDPSYPQAGVRMVSHKRQTT